MRVSCSINFARSAATYPRNVYNRGCGSHDAAHQTLLSPIKRYRSGFISGTGNLVEAWTQDRPEGLSTILVQPTLESLCSKSFKKDVSDCTRIREQPLDMKCWSTLHLPRARRTQIVLKSGDPC
jgi:hypothetical protein